MDHKYRSLTYIYFIRSIFMSFWSIILKYDINPSNSLQDIRQNHWTMKYRSLWSSSHDTKINVIGMTDVCPNVCCNKPVLLNFCRVWFLCVCLFVFFFFFFFFFVFFIFVCVCVCAKSAIRILLDEYGSYSKELIRMVHLMYGNE